MFLPDRYIKGECPNCHSKDQYGDACEVCSTVYAPTDLINPYSTLSGAKPVLKTSEHFFFRLSDPQCVAFLEEWLEAPGRLQPQVANKAREWLVGQGEQALERLGHLARRALLRHPDSGCARQVLLRVARCADRLSGRAQELLRPRQGARATASRAASSSSWRRPTPSRSTSSARTSSTSTRCSGRRCCKFAGPPYKVPDHVYVHGFITVSGEKMSKSRGTGISPLRYLDIGMNAEWLRYYIAAKLNASVEDIDFNPDDFVARVNSDLIGKYVNIASRAANFITRHFGGELRYSGDSERLSAAGAGAGAAGRESYEQREFGKAMRDIMALADRINQEFDAQQPWVLARDPAKTAQLQDVCSRALHGFKLLSVLLAPVLPEVAARVAQQLFGLAAAVPLERCRGAARADQSLPAPDDARRSETARCAVRDRDGGGAAPRRTAVPGRSARWMRLRASPSMTSAKSTCALRASSTPRQWPAPTSC